MKRRALLIRTIATAVSSSVFTAVGWLMGTRSLLMFVPADPQPACCAGGMQSVGSGFYNGCIGANCPQKQGVCGQFCVDLHCASDVGQYCGTRCSTLGNACCTYE